MNNESSDKWKYGLAIAAGAIAGAALTFLLMRPSTPDKKRPAAGEKEDKRRDDEEPDELEDNPEFDDVF